jgi:hypothetical protein
MPADRRRDARDAGAQVAGDRYRWVALSNTTAAVFMSALGERRGLRQRPRADVGVRAGRRHGWWS